jgi:molybdate transport system ATP-binding protein
MRGLDVAVQGSVGTLSIDIAFQAHERPVTIVGPNGAGKTTALMLILGALKPTGGRVVVDGETVFEHLRRIDVAVERRGIGFLPQKYALFPHLDVVENVAYGLRGASRRDRRESAMAALKSLDVATLAGRRPSELSGGEAQRVALARALAACPRALVLDEPLAALDAGVRRDVREFLSQHLRALKIPTVVVTHDRSDVESLDGEVIVLERGSVVQRGHLSEIVARPATEFVRQFSRVATT